MKELFEGVEKNDEAGVRKLISGISTLDIKDDFGYYLLHKSLTRGYDGIASLLIENGAGLNVRDKNGQTPLHYAALYGNMNVAQLLLDKGADLNIADNFGNQPLWTAVFNDKGFGRRLEMIKAFIEHGADINHKNNVGKSPLDFATTANYKDVIALLS